ncbi:MOS1T transposase, partial [Pseudoatta argentina]
SQVCFPFSSVAIMLWSREQRAFAVDRFFGNGRSVVATQHAFRARFEIPPHRLVPGRNSILSWVNSFQECGSVAKPRNGRQRNSRTPEAVERVRQSILRSPRRSARKHAVPLGILDTTVRRILHKELQFHPYKLAVVQQLSERDFVARQNLRCDLPWPARSPDLSPCDFFTITGDRYRLQLMRLSRALKEKRPLYAQRHDKVILLHDNARPHVAKPVKIYLETLKWEVLPHPPYSPDIAPSDFHLFRSMAHGLADRRFHSYEEAQKWIDS